MEVREVRRRAVLFIPSGEEGRRGRTSNGTALDVGKRHLLLGVFQKILVIFFSEHIN